MKIDDVSNSCDRVAWALALEVAETGRGGRAAVRRALAAHRARLGMTRLKNAAALSELVLRRVQAIVAKRLARRTARASEATFVPVSQRWPALARDDDFRQRLSAYHVWRAVEALSAAD